MNISEILAKLEQPSEESYNTQEKVRSMYRTLFELKTELSNKVRYYYADGIDNNILPGHLSIPRGIFQFLQDIDTYFPVPPDTVIFNKYNEDLDYYIAEIQRINNAFNLAIQLDTEYGLLLAKVMEFKSLDEKQQAEYIRRYKELDLIVPGSYIKSGIDIAQSEDIRLSTMNYIYYINRSSQLREQWKWRMQ